LLIADSVPGGEASASVASGVTSEIVTALSHGGFIFSTIAFSVGAFMKCSSVCDAEVLLTPSLQKLCWTQRLVLGALL